MDSTVEQKTASNAEAPATPKAWQETGFAAVYTEHSQAIYYLALRLLGDPTAAQDATHDVFMKAFRKIGDFRGDASVRTWLYRITINHCRNLLQSWHHRTMIATDDEAVWERAGHTDSPLKLIEIRELGERIQKTLETLPEEYRILLLLVADEKLSYQEVAELTGQSADAVRGKLHRARKAFVAAFPQTA